MEISVYIAVVISVAAAVSAVTVTACALCVGITLRSVLLIYLCGDLIEFFFKVFLLCFDILDVVAFKGLFKGVYLGLERRFIICGEFVAKVFYGLFGLIYHLVGAVSGVDLFAVLLILCGILFCLFNGFVDILFAHVGGAGDGDMLFFSGTEIL